MKKQLKALAITATLLSVASTSAFADDDVTPGDDQHRYLGASIGAITGALLAGPVGFISGGVIGSFARTGPTAESSEVDTSAASDQAEAPDRVQATQQSPADDATARVIVLAQHDGLASVIGTDRVEATDDIETSLLSQINFDIFFLSGSTAVEAFYKPRIQTIAGLLEQQPGIDIHLEGYSDRRGDVDENLALANQRLESVRDELEQAGVDAERIHLTAYGEQQFISKAGHLEAYTFDRRVVVRFEPAAERSVKPIAQMDTSSEH